MTREELRENFNKNWELKKEELESLTVEELHKKTLAEFQARKDYHSEMFTLEKKNMFKASTEWEKEMHRENAEEHFEMNRSWGQALSLLKSVLQEWSKEDFLLHLLEHRKWLDLRRELVARGLDEETVNKLDLN